MISVQRAFLKTPIGYLELLGTDEGLQQINFLDFRVKVQRIPGCLKEAVNQLEEYFYGKLDKFSITIDITGSPFQIMVWSVLANIPFGSTMTYVEIANRLGNIHSLRAVGGASASNPVPLIIPCHRVIGSTGKLIGYAGGLKRKKWLLEHEHAFSQRDLFYK